MKKLILALTLALTVTAFAAERQIDFFAWAFDHEATDLTDASGSTGILENYDVLWQLIHSESGSPAAPNLENAYYLGEGDSLLDSRFLTGASHSGWELNLLPDGADYPLTTFTVDPSSSSYYVYQRIYELDRGTTAPGEGTYYYDSEVVDLVTQGEWDSEFSFAVYAMGNDAMDYGVKPNQQVPYSQSVPEPATMGLLGLGALVLGLRRRLRK